ncbi:MAG: PIN domain-containing protein [Myxococcota bacterium]
MILIDTSAWIDFFRGRGALADAVDGALEDGRAALCGPIITEIRRGLGSASERRKVLPLLAGCRLVESPAGLWEEAGDIGYALRRRGKTVKTLDLLIAVHALASDLAILTADHDFRVMRQAGIPLRLAADERSA